MSRIRLFVTDMDGTLFNSKTEISDENIKALGELRRKGVLLVLASGRMAKDVPVALKEIGIAYFIESDGGMIRDLAEDEVIYHQAVQWETAASYVSRLEHDGYFVYIHWGRRFIASARNRDARLEECYPGIFDDCEEVDQLGEYIEKEKICPEKIGTLLCSTERIGKLLAYGNDFSGITVVQTNTMAVEAHSPKTSKGDALKWLADRLGIGAGETVAVGDSDNDISMLRWAGEAYAMGNGTAGAKAAAGRVTASNDEDGVAQVIGRYLK